MSGSQKRQSAAGRASAPTARPGRTNAPPSSLWLRSPVLHAPRLPADLALLGSIGLALVAVYALSTSPTVLLEDDGLFLMSSATLGISHPPGYPVHTWLGWLAAHVPVGSTAFRVHALSGVLGAVACMALGWVVLRRTGSRMAVVLAALSYGVSEHFWSQSVLAEVYTLNAVFFFALLALCLEAAANPTPQLLIAVALLSGLSLGNHWPLMILATPALALTLGCRWREVARRLPVLVPAFLLGALVPYVWMIWRSNQDPAISFYGPIRSLHDAIFYVSRKGYARVDVSATAGWTDKLHFAGYVARESLLALTPVGAGLAVAGVIKEWRDGWRLPLLGEVAACLASGLLLAFILGFDYDFLKVAVFRPYPLVAYGLMALWMASGVTWALAAVRSHHRMLAPLVAIGLLGIPGVLAASNWTVNDRSRDDFADRHARLLLDLVDPDSILLVYGDSDTGPVGYLHTIEAVRPDVTVYNLQGLVFANRLLPALSSRRIRDERLRAFLRENRRPVYHMTDDILPPIYAEEHLGFLRRVLPGVERTMPRARYRPEAAAFFHELMEMPVPRDRWVSMTRNQLLHQYGTFLGLVQVEADEDLRTRVGPLVTLARSNYYGLTGMVEMLAQHGANRAAWTTASAYLDEASRVRDDSLDGERRGREYYLRGFVAYRLGNPAEAQLWFERSVDAHPSPDNASRLALTQLARHEG